jgi:hypothetical protein
MRLAGRWMSRPAAIRQACTMGDAMLSRMVNWPWHPPHFAAVARAKPANRNFARLKTDHLRIWLFEARKSASRAGSAA